ncbi:hypothetical protein Tco_0647313, partial [Tanacetum coccineum]
LIVYSNVPPGGASISHIPTDVPTDVSPGGASSSHIPTDVPTTGVAPAGVSNKGKTPMVEE